MKILFVLNTPGFLRYFDATIESLLARGDDVALAFTRPDLRPESLEILDDWSRKPEVLGKAPDRDDHLAGLAASIRAALDYVRYLDRRFARMEYLRNRRRRRSFEVAPWTRVFRLRSSLPRPLPHLLVGTLLACERALPSCRSIEDYVRGVAPDVLVVSPLVTGASPQTDYVKAGKALGIPSALCVASWDNLTNKGLIRDRPHRVVVWNEAQLEEAVTLHRVPRAMVDVTGAQPFDRWFDREPSCSRDEFCAKTGLPLDRRILMFVGSTSNIAREGVEEAFVHEWIAALRSSDDEMVAHAGILVRPHPDRPGSWEQMALDDIADVVLWPPRRPNSVTTEARTDYFDSLHHADVVVGINTSAMIEAAVIGRPVLTVSLPEFEQAQQGTMHFAYLLPENGGFVVAAQDLGQHVRQVGEHLRDPQRARNLRDRFVETFIRPRGLDRPANDVLVESIDHLAAAPRPRSARVPVHLLPLSALLIVLARRQNRSNLDAVGARLERRTRRISRIAERLEAVSPTLARPVARLARRQARRAESHLAVLAQRHELERKKRKALSRAEKQRGVEMLARQRMEVGRRR